MLPSPAQVNIRRSNEADHEAITQLIEIAWTASDAEALPDGTISELSARNSIATLVADRIKDLWVAERKNLLVGTIAVNEAGYIWALYVHPNHQRKGIGTTLVTEIEKHFRAIGLKALSLDIIETNQAAQNFYTANHWQEEGRRSERLPGHTATIIRYVRIL